MIIKLSPEAELLFTQVNEIEHWEICSDPLRYHKKIILVLESKRGTIEIHKNNFFVTSYPNSFLTESIHFHEYLLDFIKEVQKSIIN